MRGIWEVYLFSSVLSRQKWLKVLSVNMAGCAFRHVVSTSFSAFAVAMHPSPTAFQGLFADEGFAAVPVTVGA